MRSLDKQFTYRLKVISKLSDIESNRYYLKECGLNLAQTRTLATVGTFEPLSINLLAQSAVLDKSQASRAAKEMVELGYLNKTRNQEDERGISLTLTPKGRKLFTKVIEAIEARNKKILEPLTAQEIKTLDILLEKMVGSIAVEA